MAADGSARAIPLPVRGRSKARARPVLRWIHATFGLFAAVYVLVASASGAVLLFKEEIIALAHPELGAVPADIVGQAQRLAASLPPAGFTSIKFPDDALPAFIVARPGGTTALYDPVTLAPLPDRFGLVRATDWIFDLHHHLLAGETGTLVSGAFGLAVAGLILIGFYLWWPGRRSWRLSRARAKRPTRAAQLGAHMTLAVLTGPLLFVAAVTGSAVIFHEQARGLLVAILGEKDPAIPVPAAPAPLPALKQAVFPQAEPRLFIPPRGGGAITLRLRQPAEFHPNGRSTLSYDPVTERATAAASEPEAGAGDRVYNLLYPIHTGVIGGVPLRLLYFTSAALAFLAALHGLRSYILSRGRVRANSRRR